MLHHHQPPTIVLGLCLLLCGHTVAREGDGIQVRVDDREALLQALNGAVPGLRILVEPGEYRGGLQVAGIRGREGAPVVVEAADRRRPPVFRGGGTCIQLSDVEHVELRGLVLVGASGNGLNIDDGGSYDTPSRHVVLRDLKVSDIGPRGNRDGIKLSGLDHFRVESCEVERWGSAGQGIDMVGCHHGIIAECVLRFEDDKGSGIQAKGGSRDIRVQRCRFEHAGSRAVNIGGSTGLKYFRPPLASREPHWEAKEITVEGCTFIGSMAPVAFVGVDGATARFNTIYRPRRWVVRILQETRAEGFVPCRSGSFVDNIVVFRSGELSTAVNVGPATDPSSFTFERNWWFCVDRPERSRPQLPVAEKSGVVGEDPRLREPEQGDLSLEKGSPAAERGAGAWRPAEKSPTPAARRG